MVDTYLRKSLDTDEHERATGGWVSREAREAGADGLDDVLDDYRDALRENDLKFIKRRAQELADTYKLSLGPEEFAVWSREVLKAEIKLLAIIRQRERGDYGFERQVLNPPGTVVHVSNSKDTDTPSPRLSEVIDVYVKEMLQVGKWRLKTEVDNKALLALFLEIIGDKRIDEVGFADVRRFKEVLTRLPPNRSKIARYRDLSIDELLELKGTTPMALRTINKALIRVSTLLNWAMRHGYVSQNYAQGLLLPNPKREDEERNPWSQEDLRLLFSPDSYNEKRRYRHTYMFWLPILGLFTGARLEEICQLHLSDIHQADGIWVIDINDAVGKKVKTKSSRRLIPLHPVLKDIGFVKYVERLKSFGKKRLFEELTHQRDGYGQYASRWFARYKVRCGIKIGDHEKKDFHSFRKTLSKALLNVETPYGFIADMLGHEKPGETARYTGRANPKLLLEWLSKVDFRLSFDHIRYNPIQFH